MTSVAVPDSDPDRFSAASAGPQSRANGPTRWSAPGLLHRVPHGRVLGVVVDDDHFEVRVVDPLAARSSRITSEAGRRFTG
jgi:hypothetical protein